MLILGSPTQPRSGYAQIAKELLAVLSGMEQFQQFTCGHKVDMQTECIQPTIMQVETAALYCDTKVLPGKISPDGRYIWSRAYLPEDECFVDRKLSNSC